MDGSALEHSDSDSGESWTLLDNSPAYADDVPEFSEGLPPQEGNAVENFDKDDDTDGISIISDSDRDSTTPCELSYDRCLDEPRSTEPQVSEYVSINPIPSHNNDLEESIRGEDDFLGDNTGKHKTYVHRRNKRLSTVLNIIVLGSVITAAGVAFGHMWGAKNECSMNTTPSVNKILSNLYKLQEENAYLRNKLKELTFVNNMQMQQRKPESERMPLKQHRCKKMFEESLNNKNAHKLTKCVDNDDFAEKLLDSHMIDHEFKDDYISDIDKLKNIYQQNKSWLDVEIARRIKTERDVQKVRNNLKSPKSTRINEDHKLLKRETLKRQLDSISEAPANPEMVINVTEPLGTLVINHFEDKPEEISAEKKISYADSLKSDHKIKKRDVNEVSFNNNINRDLNKIKKKQPKVQEIILENSVSEDDLRKDDRYNEYRYKPERKKNDRHKIHKKQKRRNKYEQWEMKGGYMKDYDDFSISSSQENEYVLKNPDKNFPSRDFERNHYINQFSETGDKTKSAEGVDSKPKYENRTSKRKGNGKMKEKDMSWYEKRAALRTEARKKLEQELFGETTPNNAGWYFRRMQRREQCRVKGDNTTYRKFAKRAMNFKTKH